jgi:hypothetical protein
MPWTGQEQADTTAFNNKTAAAAVEYTVRQKKTMKHLCRAIIWNACFFELSGDDVIDPDSSVKALEDISLSLQEATNEEKAAFIEACREEAQALRNDSHHGKTADFIESLPDAIGLVEKTEE